MHSRGKPRQQRSIKKLEGSDASVFIQKSTVDIRQILTIVQRPQCKETVASKEVVALFSKASIVMPRDVGKIAGRLKFFIRK